MCLSSRDVNLYGNSSLLLDIFNFRDFHSEDQWLTVGNERPLIAGQCYQMR